VKRRQLFALLLLGSAALRAAETVIRGVLEGRSLRLPDGQSVKLNGDEPTVKVLEDARLTKFDLEVIGERRGSEFQINPIHTRAIFTYKQGKRLMVTYWCDICYIRTYSPGICWCCQDETRLDLIDPDSVEKE
jgi:hypothetical protein